MVSLKKVIYLVLRLDPNVSEVKMQIAAIILAVASYGLLRNFSPDIQYFSDYLTGPKNFTRAQVTQEIYSVVTYCNMILALVALLVTDLLRYKPIIILGVSALICCKFILYFGTTVAHMQLSEMFYAISRASNLSYTAYIYTQIDKEDYQLATAIVNISPKVGVILSSLIAQILLFFQIASLENLLQLNLVVLVFAFILALRLPPANDISAPTNEKSSINPKTNQVIKDSTCDRYQKRVKLLWKEFKSTYTNPYLLKWCLWMVMSIGGVQLVLSYYTQALWSNVTGNKHNMYNGLADSVYMVFSTTGSCIAGNVKVNWEKHVDMILCIIALLQGVFILASSSSDSLVWSYMYYIIYAALSDVSLIFYRAEMAQHLENFGLIFGINLFLANSLESILTFMLNSKEGLALSIRDQFTIIGCYFIVLGAVFLMKAMWNLLKSRDSMVIQQISVIKHCVNTHL